MRRFFSQMNPTVRGLLIVALIAVLVIALNLYVTLAALYAIAGIAFFLAIAFFVYLLWRDRRQEIATWPTQAKIAFYLGAFTIVFALGAYFVTHPSGLERARLRARPRVLGLRHVARLARPAHVRLLALGVMLAVRIEHVGRRRRGRPTAAGSRPAKRGW